VIIVIAIMVHIAIVLAVLRAVRPGVLLMRPTMVLVILIAIAIAISDGDIAKINSYSRSRERWGGQWDERDERNGGCEQGRLNIEFHDVFPSCALCNVQQRT
jgi:hypothetical protein